MKHADDNKGKARAPGYPGYPAHHMHPMHPAARGGGYYYDDYYEDYYGDDFFGPGMPGKAGGDPGSDQSMKRRNYIAQAPGSHMTGKWKIFCKDFLKKIVVFFLQNSCNTRAIHI